MSGLKPGAEPLALSACALLIAPGEREGDEPLLFLTRRSGALSFLPGFHACPGGGLEPGDGDASADQLGALRRCAARELYEEIGLALTRGGGSLLEDAREEIALPERLAMLNEALDLRRYHAAGRWRTPEWAPLRFETEFFLIALSREERLRLDASPTRARAMARSGLEEGAWRTAKAWLARHDEGALLLTLPTLEYLKALSELGWHGIGDQDQRDAFHHGERDVPSASRRYAHAGRTWCVPLKSPTLPPATHTHCYVIGDTQRFVVIDPGAATELDLEPLVELLDELFAQGAQCEAIVLTHHHQDHLAAIPLIRARYPERRWPIWAHALTEALIAHQVERRLHHGELLELGAAHTLEVRETPGHAPGHVALLHRESGALFCGDLVASQGTILVAPPEGHMGDYLESLAKIRALGASSLHPAHGWAVADAERLLSHYIIHRERRERRALEALKAIPSSEAVTALQLVAAVYDDVPEAIWPIAALSLEAHLIHLGELHEQVERVASEGVSEARYRWREG